MLRTALKLTEKNIWAGAYWHNLFTAKITKSDYRALSRDRRISNKSAVVHKTYIFLPYISWFLRTFSMHTILL